MTPENQLLVPYTNRKKTNSLRQLDISRRVRLPMLALVWSSMELNQEITNWLITLGKHRNTMPESCLKTN